MCFVPLEKRLAVGLIIFELESDFEPDWAKLGLCLNQVGGGSGGGYQINWIQVII